eukprot:TRINITY_DN10589_c0_g2_i1.p1 TRINITY_DN10589_c0_g2~~TRINITY_DN10589_c0_g2_i1.p1  ORF type:complete len:848 (+),score=167.20 TRINITY_DN10589_c0_g2_i1:35-2545(+)
MEKRQPRAGVRRGGNFAKRQAASTKISRKIGWLNSHGGLAGEIRYNEVKDYLGKLGDQGAMVILQNLEERGAHVREPTAYIVTAAKNSLKGEKRPRQRSRRSPPREGTDSVEDQVADDNAVDDEAREEHLSDAKEPGDEADVDLEVDLDENAEDADAEGKPDEEMPDIGGAADDAEKPRRNQRGSEDLEERVDTRINWLNENGGLTMQLKREDVFQRLVGCGLRDAMRILKELEQHAGEVRDPTGYVVAACSKSSRKGTDRGRRGAKSQSGKGGTKRVIKSSLKTKEGRAGGGGGSEDDMVLEKIRKRISWLNDKANLQGRLEFEEVGKKLLRAGPMSEAMKILKTLEESASQVRNPTAYVANAARRLSEEGFAPDPPNERKQQAKDFRRESLDMQLKAHITWMNHEVPLAAPIDFEQVAGHLLEMETSEAGEILKRLEENAKEVRDPNGYIISASRKRKGNKGESRGSKGESKGKDKGRGPKEPAPRNARGSQGGSQGGSQEEQRLLRRVTWLNDNMQLQSPLDYDRIAEPLLRVGYLYALEVLNNLQEHAKEVRDPNSYVIAGARKRAAEDGGGSAASHSSQRGSRPSSAPPMPTPPPPAPPRVPGGGRSGGDLEEKLSRRVDWLNRNVCRDNQMQFSKVSQSLLRLTSSQAFEVLKVFEDNASTVRDPNGYIISTARKALSGQGPAASGGRDTPRAPRPVHSDDPRPPPRPPPKPPSGSRSDPIGSFSGTKYLDRGAARPSEAPRSSDGGRLRNQISRLASSAQLQGTLDVERVSSQLSRVNDGEGMEILKRLEEKAREIRDPTAYVVSAVRRALDNGKGSGKGGGKRRGGRD